MSQLGPLPPRQVLPFLILIHNIIRPSSWYDGRGLLRREACRPQIPCVATSHHLRYVSHGHARMSDPCCSG